MPFQFHSVALLLLLLLLLHQGQASGLLLIVDCLRLSLGSLSLGGLRLNLGLGSVLGLGHQLDLLNWLTLRSLRCLGWGVGLLLRIWLWRRTLGRRRSRCLPVGPGL